MEDRPILLSVGYSACHWCHVMEHESFEDPETARGMNEHFINIKVDREERPDVDSIYMDAVQQMTGRGGWPMTVFLTPEGEAFFGGTYYPPQPRHGLPSFQQVLLGGWQRSHGPFTLRLKEATVADSGGYGSPEAVYERIQNALEALGAVEIAVGDAGSDTLRDAVIAELNTAVVALQSAREKVVEMMDHDGSKRP